MVLLVVVLIVLALVFGIGAVIEGIAWALFIGIVLLALGIGLAVKALRRV